MSVQLNRNSFVLDFIFIQMSDSQLLVIKEGNKRKNEHLQNMEVLTNVHPLIIIPNRPFAALYYTWIKKCVKLF